MSSITCLPPEIFQNIFSFLDIGELLICMTVCKTWRNLINCNYLWGRYYKLYDIEELLPDSYVSDKVEASSLSPLCSRVRELKRFYLSSAFNWRFGRSKNFYITLKYRNWKVACHEPFLAVMYLSLNQVNVFSCLNNSLECVDIISVNLPKNILDQTIVINSKYIVIGSCNITVVYKLIEGHFQLFRIFALKYEPTIYIADNDFDNFLLLNILPDFSVLERVLKADMLWITLGSGTKHIINLNTGQKEVKTSLLIHTKVVQYSPYIVNYVDLHMLITDIKGEIISSFNVPHVYNTFYMNSSVIVLCFPKIVENQHYSIECREILTGKLLRRMSIHERTRVTLHPKKDILFLLSTHSNITCLCIETGNNLWSSEISSGSHTFWGSFLSVINDRFLFVYPSPYSDELYALYNLNGKLLYENPFISGVLLYFSEIIVLAKEEGRLHLTTFL